MMYQRCRPGTPSAGVNSTGDMHVVIDYPAIFVLGYTSSISGNIVAAPVRMGVSIAVTAEAMV